VHHFLDITRYFSTCLNQILELFQPQKSNTQNIQ